jgi:hypothetical protein
LDESRPHISQSKNSGHTVSSPYASWHVGYLWQQGWTPEKLLVDTVTDEEELLRDVDDTLDDDPLDLDDEESDDVDEEERDELISIFTISVTPFLSVEKKSPPNLLALTRELSDLYTKPMLI